MPATEEYSGKMPNVRYSFPTARFRSTIYDGRVSTLACLGRPTDGIAISSEYPSKVIPHIMPASRFLPTANAIPLPKINVKSARRTAKNHQLLLPRGRYVASSPVTTAVRQIVAPSLEIFDLAAYRRVVRMPTVRSTVTAANLPAVSLEVMAPRPPCFANRISTSPAKPLRVPRIRPPAFLLSESLTASMPNAAATTKQKTIKPLLCLGDSACSTGREARASKGGTLT